jgi:hypothetical protein
MSLNILSFSLNFSLHYLQTIESGRMSDIHLKSVQHHFHGQNGRRRSRQQITWEKVVASDTLRNGRRRPFGNDRLDGHGVVPPSNPEIPCRLTKTLSVSRR